MTTIGKYKEKDMVFVAIRDGEELVGVLRGRKREASECIAQGITDVTLAATIYAIPFYLKLGDKKTAGIRVMDCFDGAGLGYQLMKKVLVPGCRVA